MLSPPAMLSLPPVMLSLPPVMLSAMKSEAMNEVEAREQCCALLIGE